MKEWFRIQPQLHNINSYSLYSASHRICMFLNNIATLEISFCNPSRSVTYGHLLIPRWFYNPGTHNFDDSKLNQPAAGAKKIQDVIFWNRCFWQVGSVGVGGGVGGTLEI